MKRWNSQVFFLVVISALILGAGTVYSAPQDNLVQKQQQILQQKEQEQASKRAEKELQYRVGQSMTKTQQQGSSLEVFLLPKEENSFLVKHFSLKTEKFGYKFAWINQYLTNFNGQKIGVKGINELMGRINAEIVNRGYVTTRVYVEQQDLSNGKMFFTLMPGIISDVRFKEETWGTWYNAMPMARGSLLNIRDIEQAIDNFNNVPNQNADIKIKPGAKEGESELVIEVKRSKPWSLFATVDNSGTDETGKVQMTAGFQLSQPFSANDLFYVSWNEDATQSGEKKGTRANSLYYSIPFGNERISFSHSKNDYHQTVEYAVNPFVSSGEFTNTSLTWTHLVNRGRT